MLDELCSLLHLLQQFAPSLPIKEVYGECHLQLLIMRIITGPSFRSSSKVEAFVSSNKLVEDSFGEYFER
jgi:hypothetical protein